MSEFKSQLFNVKKAAEFLGVNPKIIQKWAKDKSLKSIKDGNSGDMRFAEEDLINFTKSGNVNPSLSKYNIIKKFLNSNAYEIQAKAMEKHTAFIGKIDYTENVWKKQVKFHIKVIERIADNLTNLQNGTIIFKRIGKELAVNSVKEGLTLEQTLDGTIFLKQSIWEELWKSNLFEELTNKDIYEFNIIISTFCDVVASQIAIVYHRNYRESLQQAEEPFRHLVESVKDYAIFMLDVYGNIISWNPGAERFKGYKPNEIIGKHFSIFYTEKDKKVGKPKKLIETAMKEDRAEDEGWRVRKDGSKFWANIIITAIRDDKGKLTHFAKITRDLTERRDAEIRLKNLNEELEERIKNRTNE